jgi:PAS domain S-box-containing protein
LNTFLSLLTAQTLVTVFLAVLLWSLSRHLQGQAFNRWWAWAWTSSAIFLVVAQIQVSLDTAPALVRGTLVFIATLAGFMTVPLLAFGVISFRSPRAIGKKLAIPGLSAALAVGALTFAASLLWTDPIASFSVRQGARTLALGVVLLFCAWVFFERARATWSWAATVTGSSCLIYGFNQFFFASALLRTANAAAFDGVADRAVLDAASLLLLDVFFTGGICLGMMLLLVEDHQRAERALSESVDRGRAVSEENVALQSEISKRQLVEQELRRSEEKFASAFHASPCAMTITSLEGGRFIDVNQSFERQMGYSKGDVLGQSSADLDMWPDVTQRNRFYADLRAHGRSPEREVRLHTKAGRTMWAILSAETITVGGQRCVLSVGLDVTARKEAEARHGAIVKALPDWLFLLSKEGEFVEFHAKDQSHLVLSPEQFIGRRVGDVLPPDLATRISNCVAQSLQSDQLVTLEYSLPIGDGLRFYEVRAVPSDRDHVLCLVRDMTDQKRAQHRARELQDELAHVGRVIALGTLTGSLAHEINQPLAAITTNAHTALVMLEATQPDVAEVCAALNDIKSDSQRIDDVLRHLRSLLRKERREYDPVDVNSLVTEVLALVHSDVIRRQISLDVALAPDLKRVYGDRIQLQQVVLNLLMNACEAVRAVDVSRRQVRLTTAAEEGRVVVSVSDCGIGFAGDQIDRMFEPFFTTTAEGLGLGLSICRTIIDAHGGLISARPNPDNGLTCWFSLAALAPVEEALAQRPSPLLRSKTWT